MGVTAVQTKKFWDALASGETKTASARFAGISEATAYRMINKAKVYERSADSRKIDQAGQRSYLAAKAESMLVGAKEYEQLSPKAQRALEDFDYFRLRYFGRIAAPWQKMAAEEITRLLATDEKEYVVLNEPPGAGKSTLLHDLMCWLICRNRAISLLIGSDTMTQARKMLGQVRSSLERTTPQQGEEKLMKRGLAMDAVATLCGDYGRFKPIESRQWTNEAFIVEQLESRGSIVKKESTLQAYGMDANYYGDRVDGCFWDDLVERQTTESVELRERLEERWVDLAESRLEPGGLMVLMGQRIATDDLYQFCLDMVQPLSLEEEDEFEEMTDEAIAALRRDKKYRHIVFKAHYEDLCSENSHRKDAPPYPEGCLLDPRRISWREIQARMANNMPRFRVLYQQENVSGTANLVENDWVYGYGGHPGCLDKDRDIWEMPVGIDPGECMIIATADPSPTMYWAVEMWVYHQPSEMRYLVALHRHKMDAPDFLDWDYANNKFVGLMVDWQEKSREIGFPIQFWVVEQNAAQRFLLQYNHTKRFIAKYGVDVVPHNTGLNKVDEEYGIPSLKDHYRFGRYRLMGKGEGKVRSMHLIDEATKYPHSRTNDCLMAQFFMEWNIPRLSKPNQNLAKPKRPTWAKNHSRAPIILTRA